MADDLYFFSEVIFGVKKEKKKARTFCEPVMMEDFQSAGYGVADARRSQERIVVHISRQTFSGDRSVTSIVSSFELLLSI
jgi:hypothetical protein